jgi:hypothetical protein
MLTESTSTATRVEKLKRPRLRRLKRPLAIMNLRRLPKPYDVSDLTQELINAQAKASSSATSSSRHPVPTKRHGLGTASGGGNSGGNGNGGNGKKGPRSEPECQLAFESGFKDPLTKYRKCKSIGSNSLSSTFVNCVGWCGVWPAGTFSPDQGTLSRSRRRRDGQRFFGSSVEDWVCL